MTVHHDRRPKSVRSQRHAGTTAGRASRWMAAAVLAAACGLAPAALASPSGGQSVQVQATTALSQASSQRVWSTARAGKETDLLALLADLQRTGEANPATLLGHSIERLDTNIQAREALRAEQIAKASGELDEHLAKAAEATTPGRALSDALAKAVELQLLKRDTTIDLFKDPRIPALIKDADAAAHKAEDAGDWLTANELYFRLNVLLDESKRYDADVRRLGTRLNMIRLYAPERLWELRNTARLADGESALPAYNPYGDDFRDKLAGVNTQMLYRAILRGAASHVQRKTAENPAGGTMASILAGGLDSVETMLTTTDLQRVFAGLRDDRARETMLSTVRSLRDMVKLGGDRVDSRDMRSVIERLLRTNAESTRIMEQALLHEFGNGAMATLDDYTAIIWPDELARFRRSTQGEFTGVGIQIQLDEEMNIKVVTPLEGTPAQLAGIRADDIIKKVNGISAVGLSLDQAVEVITGPQDTTVTLTIERENPESGLKQELDFTLARKAIDLPSVKGWEKTGPADGDWNYFIDEAAGVGYIRLTGFTEDTTRDFDTALAGMKRQGLNALILDLRYNPGGLLDQAVSIANRFFDTGLIVRTEMASGVVTDQQIARPIGRETALGDLPVVVLINEGSASASEIVSGAIQSAARQGKLRALVIGQRSFGKGSVQNVFPLPGGDAAMKLTTQYYKIDQPRLIHRLPGATEWGIEPDLRVQMLPSQEADALLLRRDSDVLPLDEKGRIIAGDRPSPDDLLTKGMDPQAEVALVLLQTQIESAALRAAVRPDPSPAVSVTNN